MAESTNKIVELLGGSNRAIEQNEPVIESPKVSSAPELEAQPELKNQLSQELLQQLLANQQEDYSPQD